MSEIHPAEAGHAHGDHGHADHGHGGHSLAKYVWVFLALCFLSSMSFLTYSDLWPAALDSVAVKRLFMMAVSCAKALLVVLFFMHVKYEANWKYVLTIPASLMAVFLVLALVPDVGARVNGMFGVGGKYSEERLSRVGNQEDVRLMTDASKRLAESGHKGSHDGGPQQGNH